MVVAAGLSLLFVLLSSSASQSSIFGANAAHNAYHPPGPPPGPPGPPPGPPGPPPGVPGPPGTTPGPPPGVPPAGPGAGRFAANSGAAAPCDDTRDLFVEITAAGGGFERDVQEGTFSYCVVLTGEQVASGTGDLDGLGLAILTHGSPLCSDLAFTNAEDMTFGALYRGDPGEEGKEKLRLFNVEDGDPLASPIEDCRAKVDGEPITEKRRKLFERMELNPERFYIELANEEFEDGALRGQLQRFDGEADSHSRFVNGR